MHHRSGFAASDTAYHSFNDIELFEPPSPPKHKSIHHHQQPDSMSEQRPPTAVKMQRQDSGYDSATPTPRTSTSNSNTSSRPSVSRRVSNASSNGRGPSSSPRQCRTRPSTRRSAKSHQTTQSLYLVRTNVTPQSQPVSYFHFPSPEPIELTSNGPDNLVDTPPQSPALPPPQTTHYWTSDNTRRLEYAAIDAASRGVKGWIRRRLVPDCFVPQESRHVAFDDDTGSVRRYRLDLEEDDDGMGEKTHRRRRSWQFWSTRKNTI